MTKRREGFTLIELMIVVAIIGILAAIAIPNFLKFQLRSKTGEAKANLAAIRTAEEGYFSEYSTYVVAAQNPGGNPTNLKRVWT
ncbi:MAG TPA: pilin, partial [Deltaproteobacteria bacterium]|nr:pilin [Deltaproteobacteria bacterium]